MCVGDSETETHKCIDACPVCYIFTLDNAIRLLSGASIPLGEVDLFVEVAQVGCRLCQHLCNMWALNEEVLQTGAKVTVERQQDAPAGHLWAIMFEISEPFKFRETTGYYRENKFISWAVPVGVYSKGSEWLDHFITLRPPNPSVSHDHVFDVFSSCLENCLSNHAECEKPNSQQLPTRVLLLDDDVPDRVFVHECKPGERGSYIALSYCWGKTAQTKLLKANVEEYKERGIEAGNLPKTIQDSIVATRKLGTKYLWIDSLCIIQDSAEDKNKEIAGMAGIYKNATMTISAAATTDCGDGFLEDRPEVQLRLEKSMCLPFLTTDDKETRQVIDWIYLCPDPYMGYKVNRFSEEAINTRAWTYQESTLAPRLLIFGSGPPQWHCKEAWRIYGLDIHPENLPNPMSVTTTMKITERDGRIVPEETFKYLERPEQPADEIGLMPTWFPLLENYSQRALSFATDKLLAISALAAEHQLPEHGTYAAGLWSASLPRSLLWRRSSGAGEVASNEEYPEQSHPLNWLRTRVYNASPSVGSPEHSTWSAQYIAPTWSPMASRDSISFESASTQEEDEFHTSLAEINDVHLEPTSTLNPFGQLNFSYLDITAPMCSISWEELTAYFVVITEGEPFAYWDFIMPDDPAFFESMAEKYEPSFNPQMLADTSMQHPVDEGDASILISDAGARIRMPVIREPASFICADADTPFTSTPTRNVKQTVLHELLHEATATGLQDDAESASAAEHDECEFWLLEIERSMSPAGLVLKQVHGDVFARVGYFSMNRNLDPEIVCISGGIQVRGPRSWNWGQPENKNEWNDRLSRRRIQLV